MYLLPVAKEFGKIFSFFIRSRCCKRFSGKKIPRKAIRDVLKQSANKTIAKAARVVAAAAGQAADRAHPAGKSVKDGNKSSAGVVPIAKEVILKKGPAKRSRSDILFEINFN